MKTIKQLFPLYNWPLALVSAWLMIITTRDNECEGFIENLQFLFAGILFISLAIYTFVKSLSNFDKTQQKSSFLPLMIPLFSILSILAINRSKQLLLDNKTILLATDNSALQLKFIRLLNDSTYILNEPEIEWVCYDKGNYTRSKDVILLHSNNKNREIQVLVKVNDTLFNVTDLHVDTMKYFVIQK